MHWPRPSTGQPANWRVLLRCCAPSNRHFLPPQRHVGWYFLPRTRDRATKAKSAPTIREVASGASATSVLAKFTNTELILIDIGSRYHALPESGHYRSRKVRSGSRDHTKEPALTADEFRAAFVVGQQEAEQASREGLKIVAVDAIGKASEEAAQRVLNVLSQKPRTERRPDPGIRRGGRCGPRRCRRVHREGRGTGDGGSHCRHGGECGCGSRGAPLSRHESEGDYKPDSLRFSSPFPSGRGPG